VVWKGYVSIEQITHYFVATGVTEGAVDNAISTLLASSLIQPYDSSQDDVDASDRIAIAHCGRIHFEMATTDLFFVTEMAFATPLRSTKLVDTFRSARQAKMSTEEIQKQFFEYLIDQDKLFMRLPTDSIFDNQRQFRSEMVSRWIEHSSTQQPVTANAETENFSHRDAIVSWYDSERGYGFAEAGLGKSIFVHRTALEQAGIDLIEKGDKIVCDIAPVPKGKLEAIAIHSVQKLAGEPMPRDALKVDGVLEFWNVEKGYGFLRAENLSEDAYLSARSVGANFANKLRVGARVEATVARQRFGKLAVAVVHSVS
jgi:cold shock CspA family protein